MSLTAGNIIEGASTLYKWISGGDDADDKKETARAKARAKEAGRKKFAYEGFIKTYGKAMKSQKALKHQNQPMQDHYKKVTALLNKHKHLTQEKANYFTANTLQNNSTQMARLNPRDSGMVISELENKFLIGNQEVQEEKSIGPTLKVG